MPVSGSTGRWSARADSMAGFLASRAPNLRAAAGQVDPGLGPPQPAMIISGPGRPCAAHCFQVQPDQPSSVTVTQIVVDKGPPTQQGDSESSPDAARFATHPMLLPPFLRAEMTAGLFRGATPSLRTAGSTPSRSASRRHSLAAHGPPQAPPDSGLGAVIRRGHARRARNPAGQPLSAHPRTMT